jgi:DMSO/TMAO reductase YedYZ molybdopterin-dependent catalytic subunit
MNRVKEKKKRVRNPVHPAAGLIVREREPLNLETPFGSLHGFITSTEHFFVRCHSSIPDVDVREWRLRVEGEVENPLSLSLRELLQMKRITVPVTLECAGNGRAFLSPQLSGAQWERGAVSNAEWTGVRLSDVLRRAGVKTTAREVIFEGADKGEIKEAPRPSGKVHYARSMPVDKAMEDVLLAFQMNGQELTPAHGFPVRAIVPGWYGMASVKWLTRIIASAQRFHGYYQTVDYAYWKRDRNGTSLVPITELQVKAQIARPGFADTLRAGQKYRVHGAAWTTEAEITKVEISTDDGKTWHNTRLIGKPVRNAWRLWEYQWRVPDKPGKAMLTVRATDSEGRTQPSERDNDRGSYMVNHIVPIEVDVR